MVDLPGNEDHDDLAALDFSGGYSGQESAMDAFDDYAPPQAEPEDTGDDLEVLQTLTEAEEEVEPDLFTVSNPQKSVTVTALMDGSIQRVELTDKVRNMTESDLAEEIFVIADLARQKARAAQHELLVDTMAEAEKDSPDRAASALLRDFVGMTMNLPTPEEAAAAEKEVFATRYGIEKYGDD
jgi:hypothetical protein